MKKIPAVVMIIDPERIIFEVGDLVRVCDKSYIMSIEAYGTYGSYPAWTLHHSDFDMARSSVTIVELDLKVPVMQFGKNGTQQQYLNSEEKPVFVDTMVRDYRDHFFLTKLAFLKEIK